MAAAPFICWAFSGQVTSTDQNGEQDDGNAEHVWALPKHVIDPQ